MTEVLERVLVVAFAAAAIVAVAVIVRKMMRGPGLAGLLAPRSQNRLQVVEQAAVDAKRRLILIRRDGVEHLIMTGGPADIVIESGIGAAQSGADTRSTTAKNPRLPHTLGHAAE
jgi:flagellar protein FliO/FliZ